MNAYMFDEAFVRLRKESSVKKQQKEPKKEKIDPLDIISSCFGVDIPSEEEEEEQQ
jgi:hypothetical protein